MTDTTPGGSAWVLPDSVQAGPAPGYVYVGFWRRFAAFVIDALILLVPTWILFGIVMANVFSSVDFSSLSSLGSLSIDPVTGQPIPNPRFFAAFQAEFSQTFRWLALMSLGLGFLQALYHAGLWSAFGATIGQRLLGMEVRSERDGSRIGFWRGMLRYLGYLVSGIVLYIGFIWAAFDPRKQGWHDKIAGTVVVRRIG